MILPETLPLVVAVAFVMLAMGYLAGVRWNRHARLRRYSRRLGDEWKRISDAAPRVQMFTEDEMKQVRAERAAKDEEWRRRIKIMDENALTPEAGKKFESIRRQRGVGRSGNGQKQG